GIVVRTQLGERIGCQFAEAVALRPDPRKCAVGLGDDLIGSPELEILRRARDHLLALADLPAVGAEVAEQGVRVVELYGGAGERLFRPGFGAQRLDRGLVAAEGE